MAKEINFAEYDFTANEERFTPEELRTLTRLIREGTRVFLAPIEIEDRSQFEALHITQEQCRTWRVGSEKVLVHLTPADEQTYTFLLNELRSKHRQGYRSIRCMVPGRQKPLVRCPDSNKCSACPYGRTPQDRDPNSISWEEFTENGLEPEDTDRTIERLHAKLEYDEIRRRMIAEDPLIALAFEMKERDDMTVDEIVTALGVTTRQVYYLLQKAKAIGAKFNKA